MTIWGFNNRQDAINAKTLAQAINQSKTSRRSPLPWSPRGYVCIPKTTITAASYSTGSGSSYFLEPGTGEAWMCLYDADEDGILRQIGDAGSPVSFDIYNLGFRSYPAVSTPDDITAADHILLVNEDAWGKYYIVEAIPPKDRYCVAMTPVGGIPARSGTTPGSATCDIYHLSGGVLVTAKDVDGTTVLTKTIYHLGSAAVEASTYIQFKVDYDGNAWVDMEDCGL